MTDRVNALQAQLRLSSDLGVIVENRKQIDETLVAIKEEVRAVEALRRANQAMCKHPNGKSYNDPRDPGGWDCPDCGASR